MMEAEHDIALKKSKTSEAKAAHEAALLHAATAHDRPHLDGAGPFIAAGTAPAAGTATATVAPTAAAAASVHVRSASVR